MNQFQRCDIPATVARIRRDIAVRPTRQARLAPSAVLALDVLHHALEFIGKADALAIWRTALWHGRIPEPGLSAIVQLLEHLNVVVAVGEGYRVAEICDCLEELLDPTATPERRGRGLGVNNPAVAVRE